MQNLNQTVAAMLNSVKVMVLLALRLRLEVDLATNSILTENVMLSIEAQVLQFEKLRVRHLTDNRGHCNPTRRP